MFSLIRCRLLLYALKLFTEILMQFLFQFYSVDIFPKVHQFIMFLFSDHPYNIVPTRRRLIDQGSHINAKAVIKHFSNLVSCFDMNVYIQVGRMFLCPHKVAAYRVALVRTKIVSDLILENYLSNPHQTLHTRL